METYSVYILFSSKADRYYIGYSRDVARRVEQHNDPRASRGKYSAKNGPWVLCYTEPGFTSKADAMKREKQIKGWKSRAMIRKLIDSQALESSVGIPT